MISPLDLLRLNNVRQRDMNWRNRIDPSIHGFAERINKLPVDHLTREGFRLTYDRKRWLSAEELNLLITGNRPLTLVIAKLGSAFRWYDEGDYRFWKNEGASHIADTEGFSLDDFPDARAYLASEWSCLCEPHAETVILFEEHH